MDSQSRVRDPNEENSGLLHRFLRGFLRNSCIEAPDRFSFIATIIATLTVYLLTLAPDVTLGFSGIFSVGAMYAGVPHPPGYPLSTLYEWLFVQAVPFSGIAWRVAASSALAGALACGMVALMVSRLGPIVLRNPLSGPLLQPRDENRLRIGCGCVAGTVFGFSSSFWERAVIADVWTFNVMLFCGTLSLLMRWSLTEGPRGAPLGAIFVYGLTLTNSQIMLAAAPAIPFLVAGSNQKLGRDLFLGVGIVFVFGLFGGAPDLLPAVVDADQMSDSKLPLFVVIGVIVIAAGVRLALVTKGCLSEWKEVLACGVVFLFGLSACLWVPLASMSNPPVNWGYPRTVTGFVHVLTRGQYERIHPAENMVTYASQVWMYLGTTGRAYGWACLVPALIPFVGLRAMALRERRWFLASLALFASLTLLLVAVLNPARDRQSHDLYRVFFTTSHVVLALWTGHGLLILGRAMVRREKGEALFTVQE